jgi:hypothetical protein
MRAAYMAAIGIMVLLFSGCIVGDEIMNFVIDPDGAVTVSDYRTNLTSDQKGENASKELADFVRDLEQKSGSNFAKLEKANAKDVQVMILRRAAPASFLVTARIPSLKDLAVYISDNDTDCTALSTERTRGIQCQLKLSKGKAIPEPAKYRADSFSEYRFALAEGTIIRAQGFSVAQDKHSALLDLEALEKMENLEVPSVTLLLEWQIP